MTHPAIREKRSTRDDAILHGRDAARRNAWGEVYSSLTSAEEMAGTEQVTLDPEDLERLSIAAHLTGRDAESGEWLARAHQGFLNRGDTRAAARCASWLSFVSYLKGETAQAGGWLSRARRLLEADENCREYGYLLYADGFRYAREGKGKEALELFEKAAELGRQCGDQDLATMALQGQGRVLIRMGEIPRGVPLLDEAMVAIKAGEVSSMFAGGVYCSVIEACGEILDMRRAKEWTLALERWCATQPDMVPYWGPCLIRRAELLQMHGDWPAALGEAESACEKLSQPTPKPPVGAAFYRKAEVHRLRGEYAEAESAYRQASRWERVPRPGLGMLWLAQGKLQAAQTAAQELLEDVKEPGKRAFVLDAAVEIMLAVKDVEGAEKAAEELSKIAKSLNAPLLHALADRAKGAVLLAQGDARDAAAVLRRGVHGFRELEAPYEEGRCRVLLAQACHELANPEAAELELSAACEIFRKLGAHPDVASVESLLSGKEDAGQGSLTSRELEVLRAIASGMTNRMIAERLHISEKTVARHVSNIFVKLDLPSRAAATAYAYQRGLVQGST
jgi:DNA-binding NarL/FixJ family response regulator